MALTKADKVAVAEIVTEVLRNLGMVQSNVVETAPAKPVQARRATTTKAAPAPAARRTTKAQPKAVRVPAAKLNPTGVPAQCLRHEFVLEAGYRLAPTAENLNALRAMGWDGGSKRFVMPTMGEVVRLVRRTNDEERQAGSKARYWATFRVESAAKPLTSHQVRFVLANGNLRGYRAPKAAK